jgi:plasmid stabilization system protein ParE
MAKRKITWTPEAKSDLSDVLDFFAKRNGNKKYSNWIYREVRSRLKLLQKYPNLGHQGLNDSARIIPFSYFGIIYELYKNEIIILSFWDFRRDPKNREDNKS